MYARPLFSITYDSFYSSAVAIRLHVFKSESTRKGATDCVARAWLQHDQARPPDKQRRPFEAPFLRQGKQAKQAAAFHVAFGAQRASC